MIRILRTLLSLGLLLSVITGCWNRQESDKVEYVLAAGIDLNDKGQIVLTVLTPVLEALKPMSGLKAEQKKTLSVVGNTTFEAVRSYIKITGKKLYWSHLQMLLIGESAAKTDARYYFDFFSSDPELRGTAYIATVKGRALDMLESSPDITALSSNYLKEIIKNSDLEGKAAMVYLSEFARKLAQPTGAQPFSPIIRLIDQSDYVKTIVGVEPYEQKDTHQSTLFYANGTGVYADGKMVGTLNGTETRGFLWVMGKLKSALVVVPCPDETDCHISLELSGEKVSKRRVSYQDGQAKIQLRIEVEFNIGDKASTRFKTDPQTIAYVQDQFSKTIQNEVKMAFHKVAVDYHSDIFAFGNSLEDRNPKLWKQIKDRWENEILPEAELDVQVISKLRRTSRTLYSPWVKADHS
ncbi:Ger(x)C family spore germination protein [Paenibacillus qinlingensis]|uniref:Ger(x)C family spore germination protein n=1 Tax=Paenibacillus qinlingensis TaxID=1837343 RepID=UPI001563C858|nr:Ger(x)C family spore germination protein [Paenibacillus qinlingensis]NQX63444.1 Ger(x)C family spore germination protein [Paenibacillus qinlingensis]